MIRASIILAAVLASGTAGAETLAPDAADIRKPLTFHLPDGCTFVVDDPNVRVMFDEHCAGVVGHDYDITITGKK